MAQVIQDYVIRGGYSRDERLVKLKEHLKEVASSEGLSDCELSIVGNKDNEEISFYYPMDFQGADLVNYTNRLLDELSEKSQQEFKAS